MQHKPDTKTFDIVFEGTARSSGTMRSDIDVKFVTTGETFKVATDEGKTHGGANTAPPPLALFTGALTSCLMTQIRAFAKRLRIPVNNVTIHGRLHWRGEQVGGEPYVSAPVGFELDVDIDSDASAEDLTRLLDAAKKGCFLEATLGQVNEVRHRLRVGDEWVDA
jgi:uncharacterized OsmC-like protein